MRKYALFSILGLSGVLLFTGITGCGTSNPPSSSSMNMSPKNTTVKPMPTVKMDVPTQMKTGASVQILVHVTQQGKPVNQVDEVMFEISPDTLGSKHTIFTAKRTGNGEFSIQHTFAQKGTYDVMYHVVAMGSMIMTGPVKVSVS